MIRRCGPGAAARTERGCGRTEESMATNAMHAASMREAA